MDTNRDWLKDLWFHPLVKRIRKNPWIKASFTLAVISVVILLLNPVAVWLASHLCVVAIMFMILVLFRYILFR